MQAPEAAKLFIAFLKQVPDGTYFSNNDLMQYYKRDKCYFIPALRILKELGFLIHGYRKYYVKTHFVDINLALI